MNEQNNIIKELERGLSVPANSTELAAVNKIENLGFSQFLREITIVTDGIKVMIVDSEESYHDVKKKRAEANKVIKSVTDFRLEETRVLDSAKKVAIAKEKEITSELVKEVEIATSKIKEWDVSEADRIEKEKKIAQYESDVSVSKAYADGIADTWVTDRAEVIIKSIQVNIFKCTTTEELDNAKKSFIGWKHKLTPFISKNVRPIKPILEEDWIDITKGITFDDKDIALFHKTVDDFLATEKDAMFKRREDELNANAEEQKEKEKERKDAQKIVDDKKRERKAAKDLGLAEESLKATANITVIGTARKVQKVAIVTDIKATIALLEFGLSKGEGLTKGLQDELQKYANKIANREDRPELEGVAYGNA